MGIIELTLLSISLAMDAFAVSICKGLALRKADVKSCAIVGLWFGGFQALMPLIGYFLGMSLEKYITKIDHWISFILLAGIGINMIWESLSKKEEDVSASLDFKQMLAMAVATSIDALAVGITFAFLDVNLPVAVTMIGVITFIISFAGVKLGSIFGSKFKKQSEILGGAVLILLGIKILLEHLGIISF